ncbi:hypothetical protein LSTR_LSTR001740 [Laodelphax striatellus]|uniref:RNA-binding S4 domain-containing protein n=1 Tax=Laodelphax striatellus TaxID=195883 RepID=A0A482XDG5_LAOST|nr:hypothetical protein LSTR_LSTR001740 [Laodelphax striatellus]
MIRRIQARFPLDYQQNVIRICSTQVIPNLKIDTVKNGRKFHCFKVYDSKRISHDRYLNRIPTVYSVSPAIALRNYSKKKNKREVKEESDSDDDNDDDDLVDKLDKNAKVIKTSVTSMRVDALIKSGLAVSRNKIDTLFYEGRLRLNGSKITKKSQRLNVGDEVDIIKGINPKNDNLLNISRIEILAVAADEEEDAINVKIRRIKQLSIENYEKHPWVEVTE